MMRLLRQHAVTVGLLVAAVVLAAVVLWDRGQVSSGEAKARADLLIDAWRSDQLSAVRVIGPNSTTSIAISRAADGSRILALRENGAVVSADEQAIDGYLSNLELGGFVRRITGMDHQALGLDKPQLTVELDMGKLHYRMVLGRAAPSPAGAHYAEVTGGARGRASYVVGKPLIEELTIAPGALRAHNLLPYLSVGVQRYEISGADGKLTLERGGWGGRTAAAFMLRAPAPIGRVRVSRRALDGWLGALAKLDVEHFVQVPQANPPSAAQLRFVPRGSGQPTGELVIGGPCPDGGVMVVRRAPEPAAGCVTAPSARAVQLRAEQLIDRHVVGTANSDMVELKLSAGGATVEMARQGDGWHLRKPTDAVLEQAAVRPLLAGLARMTGKLVPPEQRADLTALGLDPPRARVRIDGVAERGAGQDAGRVERIDVGLERDGVTFVRRGDDGAVLAVESAAAGYLLPHPSLLRPSAIYDEPLAEVRSLSLRCDGRRQQLSRDARGGWTLVEPTPAGLGADGGLAGQLVERIRKLHVVRWEAEAPSEHHQLAEPWCRIELTLAPPLSDAGAERRRLSLRIGAATPGGYFAQHDEEPAVFVVSRAIGRGAKSWLLDRAALVVADDDVERVVLSGRDSAKLVVRASAEHWVVEGQAASAAGEQVHALLGTLLAQGVVHLGPARADEGLSRPRLTIEVYRRSAPLVPLRFEVGAGEIFEDTSIYFVRKSGIDATFAVAQSRLRPLLGLL